MDWPQLILLIAPVLAGAAVSQMGPIFQAWSKNKGDDTSRLFAISADLLESHRTEIARLREEVRELREAEHDCEEENERLKKDIAALRADLTRLESRVRDGGSHNRREAV